MRWSVQRRVELSPNKDKDNELQKEREDSH